MSVRTSLTTSRRRTVGLALLSMAGLHQAVTAEGKKSKKRRKQGQCDRKVEQGIAETCSQQLEPCVTNVSRTCERHRDPEVCLARVNECCSFVGRCELQEYLTCIALLFEPSEPP
jgi:hypothetical protein